MGELQDRMIEEMKLRNLSEKTIKSYIREMLVYTKRYGKSPANLGEPEIRAYLKYLREEKGLSSSSLNVSYSALRFFYTNILNRKFCVEKISRPKREKKLPIVLSQDEVKRIIENCRNEKYKTILMAVYSTGCRLAEAVRLKITDIDRDRKTVRIEQGKGKKDRYSILSQTLLIKLSEYWKLYRPKSYFFTAYNPNIHIGESVVQVEFRAAKKKQVF